MNPITMINYMSLMLWMFPPFRQVKSPYFYFFYVLALIDPVNFIFNELFHAFINLQFILGPCVLIISLAAISSNRSRFLEYSFILSAVAIILKFVVPDFTNYILVLLISVIFLILLKRVVKYIAATGIFNIFQLALIIYMASNVLKFVMFSSDVIRNLPFFYATSLVQLLFGVFFVIFREDSKTMQIKIKPATIENE